MRNVAPQLKRSSSNYLYAACLQQGNAIVGTGSGDKFTIAARHSISIIISVTSKPNETPSPTVAPPVTPLDALAGIIDLSDLLAGTADLSVILSQTAQHVARLLNAKACGIRLLNEETGELVIAAAHNLSDTYINKGPVLVHNNPVDLAALGGETVYIADVASDPRVVYPAQARAEGLVSGVCAPMTYRGRTVGVIRVYAGKKREFKAQDQALLRSAGTHAAAGIIEAQLLEERRTTERHRRQMSYAGDIQRRMIPDRPPNHPFVVFGCVYNPSLDVGGDFYDFIELPAGTIGFTIADVVGKGIPAALLMASARSALHAFAVNEREVTDVMASVNRHMCRDTLLNEFATIFYGIFDADDRVLRYVNGGHDPPLLLRGDEFTELDAGGMVIGVEPELIFDEEVVTLEPGDVIVFYTDGVLDAMNFQGEHFGRKRLRESIRKHRDLAPNVFAEQIKWDTRRFAGLAPQTDDITIVVARVKQTT